MELKYIVLTIIKILISVPTILLSDSVNAALLGGHLDNKNSSLKVEDHQTLHGVSGVNHTNLTVNHENDTFTDSEEIPDPSPLVLPGYNLPENIFNKGKPFYLEKDPLTGKIDFESQSSSSHLDEAFYDYIEDEPSSDIYAKSNIDRKDGSLSSHKPSDINQLTPNFHDFLNLPVKYNSDKYVYPLISSSYANTKIQGNTNKYHNHKDFGIKPSTQRATVSPMYYSPTKPPSPLTTTTTYRASFTTTTTPSTTTTTQKPKTTTKHQNFHEEFDYYDYTEKTNINDIYLTTKNNIEQVYLTTPKPTTTTTKRVMSLFEQLFGDYDDTVVPTEKTKPPPLFLNLPNNKNKKYGSETKTEKTHYTTFNSYTTPMSSSSSYEVEEEYEDDFDTKIEESSSTSSTTPSSTTTVESTSATQNNSKPDYFDEEEFEYEEMDDSHMKKSTESSTTSSTTTTTTTTMKVTSLPLGENHINNLNNQQPIIVATQNIREQLNNEKVQKPPSTSNIHIAPDQDTVSFVVGHHQSVEDHQFSGTALKESPYESNPFRPFYGQQSNNPGTTINVGSAVTIQPQKNSEASLSIGVPIKQSIPGQVVDEKLDDEIKITVPSSTQNKIVFPDDKVETTNLVPPPPPLPATPINREVLQLSSKPMYHQLPSDLTPPKEKPVIPPRMDGPRPPWDPRPGHFHSGKPEYVRPPRPHQQLAYKRVDNLPNILPQFRPNMNNPSYYNRQPLLDRPSNRPIGFFENLQPPPPPKNLHNLRKIGPPPPIDNNKILPTPKDDQFNLYKTPPQVPIAHRRIGNIEGDVETLQMIQAKKSEKKEVTTEPMNDSTEKPLYVVYPVNTSPIKMDVIDSNKKETVVIGTRAESPLPPSKIKGDFNYQLNRNDSPILKPHYRQPVFPLKSEFPYPLERPDPSILNPAVPETPNNSNGNNLDIDTIDSDNHWNTINENLESRIVQNPNQISVTLKTYTEKPIAVAYTPTEPHHNFDKYSIPNYANPVIPEIRPGTVADASLNLDKPDNEFTVSAVMHTHPQSQDIHHSQPPEVISHHIQPQQEIMNHRHKYPEDHYPHHQQPQLDFQAPFQASINIDSVSEGWSVVKDRNKTMTEEAEVTTIPLATTSEFDIENFKPQLEGGFKPIYNFPSDDISKEPLESAISEREE